ncbi:hypothetical protein L798_05387, partial [Zootermopsis nevadensis]
LHIGTWNVRTLLQVGAMNGIADEIIKYRMEIVAIQEIRWKNKGVINKANFSIYYSGKDDRQGECGVGFIVTRQMRKAVLAFTPVSERICTLRVKGKLHNITLVNVYAPTEGTEEVAVDGFYDELQSVCDNISKHDMIIVLGDYNAKLWKEEVYVKLFGRNSLHEETNNNGLRVAQFAAANNLRVMSTYFPRKDIHKGTWKIPGTNNFNQIDHILVSRRWATDVENVRTFRGANSDSDHYLVGFRMKQKICMVMKGKMERIKRWNVDKL